MEGEGGGGNRGILVYNVVTNFEFLEFKTEV